MFAWFLRTIFLLFVGMLGFGCSTPIAFSNQPMIKFDRDTKYNISEQKDGFLVSILYSRYQFIPESAALSEACKSALTSIAYSHADTVGKPIQQINEQQIRMSTGRNALAGMTSCSAQVPVKWKE